MPVPLDMLKRAGEPAKKEEEEEGAPLWMVTMSDMNTLLMTFFIILFSLMVLERNRYLRVENDPESTPLLHDPVPAKRSIDAPPTEEEIITGWRKGRTDQPAAPDEITMIPAMLQPRSTHTEGGTVITVGGEFDAFNEGGWELRPEHQKILMVFLEWMGQREVDGRLAGPDNTVLIRGFTAGNLGDSVVRVGDVLHPYSDEDDRAPDRVDRADHWLLASLRARAVREVLVTGIGEFRIVPERLSVQVEAYNDDVANNSVLAQRHRNRRVEIVILPRK
ncbi:MAG: OmpA/MotB family protein [Planctomycetota bacterium]|jgi:outer membrane protein OmpA-like peptidoglycan-associated protein